MENRNNDDIYSLLYSLYHILLAMNNNLLKALEDNLNLLENFHKELDKTSSRKNNQTPSSEYWHYIWELIKNNNINTKKLTKFIGCRMVELPSSYIPYLKTLIEKLASGHYTLDTLLKITDKQFKDMTEEEIEKILSYK
jgi:hypothetical protein